MDTSIKHLIETNEAVISAILDLKRILFERDWTDEESSQYCELANTLIVTVRGFYANKVKNGNELQREVNAFYIWAGLC